MLLPKGLELLQGFEHGTALLPSKRPEIAEGLRCGGIKARHLRLGLIPTGSIPPETPGRVGGERPASLTVVDRDVLMGDASGGEEDEVARAEFDDEPRFVQDKMPPAAGFEFTSRSVEAYAVTQVPPVAMRPAHGARSDVDGGGGEGAAGSWGLERGVVLAEVALDALVRLPVLREPRVKPICRGSFVSRAMISS